MTDAEKSALLQKIAEHVQAGRSASRWAWLLGGAIYEKACTQLDGDPNIAFKKLAALVLEHESIKSLSPGLTEKELTEMLCNQVVSEACVPEEIMKATAEILEFPADSEHPEFGALLGLFRAANDLVDEEDAMRALDEA